MLSIIFLPTNDSYNMVCYKQTLIRREGFNPLVLNPQEYYSKKYLLIINDYTILWAQGKIERTYNVSSNHKLTGRFNR